MSEKSRSKKNRTKSGARNGPTKIRRWLLLIGAVVLLFVGLSYLFDFFPDEQRELRSGIRSATEKAFPKQAAAAADAYGLTFLGGGGAEAPGADDETKEPGAVAPRPDPTVPSVLLVHGLDDPGLVWRDIAPVLIDEGWNLWQVKYPNDQPLTDSTRFLSEQMQQLKARGVDEVAIVVHSMGGLISREMLTNPEMAYPEKLADGEVPRVAGLVMIATPNHGSDLARFRVFGEMRQQWVELLEGRGQFLGGILDGAGEAKLDLLPGSEFLTELNARPHPEGVQMLIIAGDVSPWAGMDFDQIDDRAPGTPPAAGQQMLAGLGVLLESMSNGSGDGLISVESTRLDGIPHHIVRGTHLTVIRNVTKGSDRIPPAVPLVADFLEQVFAME